MNIVGITIKEENQTLYQERLWKKITKTRPKEIP